MQKSGYKEGGSIPYITILTLSALLLLLTECRKNHGETERNPAPLFKTSDLNPNNVKLRSFQNPDSTWGYTIFVNSKPYLHYSRIPFNTSGSGFASKQDAETVASIIVKMILKGDMSPKLNRKTIDSLELNMKIKNQTGK
jgi:hypothetical protein